MIVGRDGQKVGLMSDKLSIEMCVSKSNKKDGPQPLFLSLNSVLLLSLATDSTRLSSSARLPPSLQSDPPAAGALAQPDPPRWD